MTKEPFETGRPARVRQPREDFKFQKQTDDPGRFTGLLTAQEKADLREQAREQILREQKDRERSALLTQYLKEERQVTDPSEILIPIRLQLAGSADYIMLDNRKFFTDQVYEVTAAVAAVLIEQMNRGWAHEEITQVVDTKGRRRFRPPLGVGFSNYLDNRMPSHMNISSQNIDGAIASMHRTLQG